MMGLTRDLLAGLALLGWLGLGAASGGARLPAEGDKASKVLDSQAKPSASIRDLTEEMTISPDDLLSIQVYDVDQLSHDYRVSPAGSLTLPLLRHPINAVGLTAAQLAEVITQKYQEAGLLTNPQVTVAIRDSRARTVTITGAVHRPQVYPLQSRTTLIDVLSQAEGISDDAGPTVTITRGELSQRLLRREAEKGGEDSQSAIPATVTVKLRGLLDGSDPSANLEIFPGDRVNVPRTGIVYVVGAVSKSGGFLLASAQEDMTVLKALALAGDVTPTARKNKAVIIRKNPAIPSGREEIPVNLQAVLAGRSPDRVLLANDILFVPDSSGKRALRRVADAAALVGSGVMIYRVPY
jgi:polysaccharide export outer membrane protein